MNYLPEFCKNNISELSIGEIIEKSIISKFNKSKVLFIGNMPEKITEYFKQYNIEVCYLDRSLEKIKESDRLMNCIYRNIEKFSAGKEGFHTVVCIESFFKFSDWQDILKELVGILEPEGNLLLKLPVKEHLELASQINSDIYKTSLHNLPEDYIYMKDLVDFFKNNRDAYIKNIIPYDYLNRNEILYGLAGEKNLCDFLEKWLKHPEIVSFLCWLEEAFLSELPVGLSCQNLIIITKSKKKDSLEYSYLKDLNNSEQFLKQLINRKEEQFFSDFFDLICYRNVRDFINEFSDLLLPEVEINISKFAKMVQNEKILYNLKKQFEMFYDGDFYYMAEKFVTTWYDHTVSQNMSVCEVPIGPIGEYYLIEDIINQRSKFII